MPVRRLSLLLAVAVATFWAGRSAAAQPDLQTKHWANTDEGFAEFAAQIRSRTERNLLARDAVKAYVEPEGAVHDTLPLADGEAGTRGEEGRVFPTGKPTTLTYYLGELKPIHEVAVLGFNGDWRANQDYEVRFADNSRQPGVMPRFADKPHLTTGDKVQGRDGGGFETRFVAEQGKPLMRKADWVQFRIWPTHAIAAGQPARSNNSQGPSVIVEVEVIGERGDVARPSAEELAYRQALRTAPKEPEYTRKDTWQQTLIAGREAILAWESQQDKLALHRSDIRLGPWRLLGPLPAKSKDVQQLRRAKTIDFAQRFDAGEGRQIGWEECREIKDFEVNDLTGFRGAEKDAVFFLCRNVTFQQRTRKKEFMVDLVADQGWSAWLPERQGPSVSSTFPLVRGGQNLSRDEGEEQLLVELRAGADGQRRFYFALRPNATRPGAGAIGLRTQRREQLYCRVRQEFTAPLDAMQAQWELEGGLWDPRKNTLDDWLPGHSDAYLQAKYRQAIGQRLGALASALKQTSGVPALAIEPIRPRLEAWIEPFRKGLSPELDAAALRARFYQAAGLCEAIALAGRLQSIGLAVEDHRQMFAGRYPRAVAHAQRVAAMQRTLAGLWNALLADGAAPWEQFAGVRQSLDAAQQEILLDTPLLAFDKLLVVKGHSRFASNWDGPNHLGNELVVLSPVRPDGQQTVIHKGSISDMDLHWDGQRLLLADGRAVWEMQADGSGLRRVTREDPPITHYDACYLPNGQIVCASNACEQAVPCTGGANVGNLHLLDADGGNERRVTFDQDHNWNPTVMNDGRVLYARWEYTDLPHYFSRMLFRMNPDGTGQMEYYGSNSYWPNAMYWPRPIPGHPTMVVCVVSGHHGVSRVGELLLLDPARGRHEAQGAVQRIPGYGQKVEPIIRDNLVGDSWPKFATPYPLAEPTSNLGAGKYFLACVKRNELATFDLCLVDVFDNITPILTDGWAMPIPLRPRPMPPVVPSQLNPKQPDATVYLADVYQGDGLRGYPRGSIKALRVGTHHYRYAGNGDTRASSYEGGWDVKRILGTVPVNEDGSAMFRVPANTPIFVQPLDAEGKAQQQMRSWYTAMPGEVASCIGCHERQNQGPPSSASLAAKQKPSDIAPFNGPVRGLSFDREVQPVLDRRCAGCHDGQPHAIGGKQIATMDLRAKQLHPDFKGDYSPAYMELQRYVRRAGYEADNHMFSPAEFEADTSVLVQMLKKGHYGVRLDRGEWERLYAWIDYNVPYPANWRESHRPPRDEQVERRAAYKRQFAGIDDRDEEPLPLPPVAKFEPPPRANAPAAPLTFAGWPLAPEQAQALQQAAGPKEMELDLGEDVKMKFALVPAGRFVLGDPRGFADEQPQAAVTVARPFYLGTLEVSNRQYARFDPRHDSAYIEGRGKDRNTRGTPINHPDQPAVRVSWNQAMAFCEWLSQQTGSRCTLPTEAEWEWACRAGSAGTFSFGEYAPGRNSVANVADTSIAGWNYGRCEPGYSDGAQYSVAGGRYAPNAWGLCDMHGNVAEWCLSVYRPYPYRADDGRDDPRTAGLKVVRGGSWNDTLRYATSASRWRYQSYQPVYNVGFRVRCEPRPAPPVATARH